MVEVIDDVLPLDFIQELNTLPHTNVKHRTNLASWKHQVVGNSGAMLLYDVENVLMGKAKNILSPLFGEEYRNNKWEITYTLGSYFSFIPWHDDGLYPRSMTIYLNELWDKDWGGYFMYERGQEIIALKPKFNRCVLLHPPVQHTTTMPTMNAPLRKSLQIFVHEAKQ